MCYKWVKFINLYCSGLEGFDETYKLVERAQQSIPNKKIILQSDGSIIRPIFTREEYSTWEGEANEARVIPILMSLFLILPIVDRMFKLI